MPGVAIDDQQPGARRRIDDRRHRCRRRRTASRRSSPAPTAIKLELAGLPDDRCARTSSSCVGQTTPDRFRDESRRRVAENVTVTGASPTVDTTSANVSVNLSEELIQGTPGGRDIWALVEAKVPGLVMSRPDVGGTSGGLQGTFSARGTDERTEHVVPERHQRRRSGGDRRRGLLLRLRRVRRHPGVDRRARHHRADVRRVPEHDHEDRRQQVERPRDVHLDRRRPAGAQRSRSDLQRYGFRPDGNTSDFVSDINVAAGGPLDQEQAALLRVVPRLARASERARAELADACSIRPTSRRVWATSRGR